MTISAEPGAELELLFNDLLVNGQAVGRAGGLAVFCFGPLPGERARVKIVSVKPKYAVAELVELLELSAQRAQPFCPVFGTCGGCQLQHLAYPAQLEWKRSVVRNALERIGGFRGITVNATSGMEHPRAYRNKTSLVIHPAHPRAGFYKQRSHDVVEIDGCPIAAAPLDAFIARVNAVKNDAAFAPAFAGVRHVVSRASSEGTIVAAITTDRPSAALAHNGRGLMTRLEVAGLSNSYGLPNANAILGRTQRNVSGVEDLPERAGGLDLRISAGSFFQVNTVVLERILLHMAPRLRKAGSVVDLYCGSGVFALFFAQHGMTALGVEEHSGAVAEARENAKRNRLERSTAFVCAKVETAVTRPDVTRALRSAAAVFLDPPRKGSDERTLGAVCKHGVPAIWYLSCDPATLARDLKFLAAKGYAITEVQPFDMFPQSGHVETLVTLERKEHIGIG